MHDAPDGPVGGFVIDDGVEWYRIDHHDLLDPFLVTVATPDDQWIFVSSSGALTAGRRSAEHALFPYETDDRLHRGGGVTGPVTLVRVDGAEMQWEPFAPGVPEGRVHRSVAKSSEGDRIRFEECHPELGMTFRYTWSSAGRFGLVRTCELIRDDGFAPARIELLDGLVDILPAGVELSTQQRASTLVDAYRRCELDEASGLALFTLEALVSDQADPAESLNATVVWHHGLDDPVISLSDRQVRRFRSGASVEPQHLVTGAKGAFLVSAGAELEAGASLRWIMVADVDHDHVDVARLRNWLRNAAAPDVEVSAAVDAARGELVELAAEVDALQETEDRRIAVHHFANVLYNSMRGGAIVSGHRVDVKAFSRFVASRNRPVHARLAARVGDLGPVVELAELRDALVGDPDLSRLAGEYLPLTFSRRHGDPSRPWNQFRIVVRSDEGEPISAYEGNWRDIFQNWEALLHSFPEYIESVVSKFVNASTLDGHNPYRISSEGIDWEVPEDGSWSNFGYWGDHQIVYLLRLLDAAHRFHPGVLERLLDQPRFSYADVPYRMLPYEEIASDPKHTLVFDEAANAAAENRVAAIGADGRLVPGADGGVHLASLAEKLLVPALAKLSNLVPGGGIWMNTQRPEWNDANNALVGHGVSVVTAFHLHEYLQFLHELFDRTPVEEVPIASPALEWLGALSAAFDAHAGLAGDSGQMSAAGRRSLLDALGAAFEDYRSTVYSTAPGPPSLVAVSRLRRFLDVVRPHLDLVVQQARRADGLVDSYRVLRLHPGEAQLEPLYPMLEGQVAAIGSTATDLHTVVELVDTMFESELYRPDQQSFLLYPATLPPSFMEKNQVPDGVIGPAMTELIDAESSAVRRDDDGIVRFASHLRSAQDLLASFESLSPGLDEPGRAEVLDAYETVFGHRAFTGRSQTMYRYEGLGSVYWHMVLKLAFALQQRALAAIEADEDPLLVAAVVARYQRVQAGLGHLKSVAAQGTFPLDPHSHTPAHTGAQQPGMTGAVKEGVLLRWGELGVHVEDGRVRFRPLLLDRGEFLTADRPWAQLGPGGLLHAGTLGFTYCGVPVVYHLVDGQPWTRVSWSSGEITYGGDHLDHDTSRALFSRTGAINRLDVAVPSQLPHPLRRD